MSKHKYNRERNCRDTRMNIVIVVLVLISGCSQPAPEPDMWPTEEWPTSTPEEQGIDSDLLAGMLESILRQDIAVDSLLVVRNGVLVLDAYRYPANSSARHIIHSCTKSITSALIGIAIAQGNIVSESTRGVEIFADRLFSNLVDH